MKETMSDSSTRVKERGRFVTRAMRENARKNIETFGWAREERDRAVAAADPWAKRSDDELWELVTANELPRAAYTSAGILYEGKKAGCPNCDEGILAHGGYPWKLDFWNAPWKLECPNCGQVYPKNDFAAFYRSALDERGMFRRALGDRTLLVNPDHPDPSDPRRGLYVDDGYGMTDERGRTHHMVAYYNQWAQWRQIHVAVNALALAHTLTGEARYAHKAAVILDRIADVYPEMDYLPFHRMGFQHSQGGKGTGRIEGNIWETNTQDFARAYDNVFEAIREDPSLVGFLAGKAKTHRLKPKPSIEAICRHIEDDLLLEVLRSCRDGRIDGNTGMTHVCLAIAAIALDRPGVTEEWLDWLFDSRWPGEHAKHKDPVPWVLVEGLDRDGMGGECGGYGLIWVNHFIELVDILKAYPEYTRHNLVRDYPKLKQCFLVYPRLNCLDAVLPPVGDSGATGHWGRAGDAGIFRTGYGLYGDPRLATLAWHFAGEDLDRLRGSVFDADPLALARRIEAEARSAPFEIRSDHLGRYGQAVLQTGGPGNGRALWIHYGHGKGHSHCDCLNLGLYAWNVDMLPDHGYPEFTGTWPQRIAWTENTISHNTLVIGDARSGNSPGGKIGLFSIAPPLRVVEVRSRTAYPNARTYGRTAALIDVSETDGYVVDVFRARGGGNHRLSYHGPSSAAATSGLALRRQEKGTFAGEDVPFTFTEDRFKSHGYSYLYDLERSAGSVSAAFTVDWKAEDLRGRIPEGREPHLRLHGLTPCDEVALASGDPPQNKPGNPRRLRYLIQSRLGGDPESQFVNVLEPYDGTPFIRGIRRLAVAGAVDPNAVAAISVEFCDGTVDIVIVCEEPAPVRVEGGVEFEGRFGLVRLVSGRVRSMRMVGARALVLGDARLSCETPTLTGRVLRVDASDPRDHRVYLDPPLPESARWIGSTIHFDNELPWDTSYDIQAAGDGWISTGEITVVRGHRDPRDFGKGYTYLVNPGDRYTLPVTASRDFA